MIHKRRFCSTLQNVARITRKLWLGIELLQERRTALISAVVTGKIDVRGWKAPESETEVEAV